MPNKTALQKGASAMAKARWAGVTLAERSRLMKQVRSHGGGRPRDPERCYCGRNSLSRARQRRFDCCKRAGKFPL